jgi:hypothetical protein
VRSLAVDGFRQLLREIDQYVVQAIPAADLSIIEVRSRIAKAEELLARIEAIRTVRARVGLEGSA